MITSLVDAFENPLYIMIFDLNDRKIIATALLKAKKEASEELKHKIDAAVKKMAETPLDEKSPQIRLFRSVAKKMFNKQVKTIKKSLPAQMKSIPAAMFDDFVKDTELFVGLSWFSDNDRKEILEIVSNERNRRNTGITNYQ